MLTPVGPDCIVSFVIDENNSRHDVEWLPNGTCIRHYADGSSLTIPVVNGLTHGICYWTHPNGAMRGTSYFCEGKLHRDDGPARTYYYSNGKLESAEWFIHGKRHRDGAAAYYRYHPNGGLRSETYAVNGHYHNPMGEPTNTQWHASGALAVVAYHDEKGKFHRDGAPAIYEFTEDGSVRASEHWTHGIDSNGEEE